MHATLSIRIEIVALAITFLFLPSQLPQAEQPRSVTFLTVRLPRVNADFWNPWQYDKNNGIREIRFEAGIRTPGVLSLEGKRLAVWTPDDGWKVENVSAYALIFNLEALGSQPIAGALEGRFLVEYQYGSFSVRTNSPLAAGEILLEMPFPEDVYVLDVNLTGLTWNAKSSASRLKSVQIEIRSGDAVCQTIAKPEESFDGIDVPKNVSCLFEWQKSLPVDKIEASIRFHLIDDTLTDWSGNGRNLRQNNNTIKLTDADWSPR